MPCPTENTGLLSARHAVRVFGAPHRQLLILRFALLSGKHGGSKARIEVVGIFDNKRRSVVKPASTEIEVPLVDKKAGQVVAITGNIAQVMDLESYETFEVTIPEELKDTITQGCEVIYWILMERKMLVSLK